MWLVLKGPVFLPNYVPCGQLLCMSIPESEHYQLVLATTLENEQSVVYSFKNNELNQVRLSGQPRKMQNRKRPVKSTAKCSLFFGVWLMKG